VRPSSGNQANDATSSTTSSTSCSLTRCHRHIHTSATMLRRTIVGVGVLGVLGGGALYAYRERLRGNASVSVEQMLEAQGGRELVLARVARALERNSPEQPATLYRYATCPFCCTP